MSGGDFIGRAEAQRCRARGVEDRAGFVADLRAVLAATADADVPVEIPHAEIAPLIERRLPVQDSHLVALYGAEGGKLRTEFGVKRARGSVGVIARAIEKGAARALAKGKPTPDPSRLREGKETTLAGAASFPRAETGQGGEALRQAQGERVEGPPTDSEFECLAGAGSVPPQGDPTGQTGEADVPLASPHLSDVGAGSAQAEDARGGGAAAAEDAAAPIDLGRALNAVAEVGRVIKEVGGLDRLEPEQPVVPKIAAPMPGVASAQAELQQQRADWQAMWEQATASALAARQRIDVIERALAALEAVAA